MVSDYGCISKDKLESFKLVISNRDLTLLAVMLTKTLNSVEFQEAGKRKSYIGKTLKLIDKLEKKYSKQSIFRDARYALTSIDKDINAFYVFTRDLIRKIRPHIHGSNKTWFSSDYRENFKSTDVPL